MPRMNGRLRVRDVMIAREKKECGYELEVLESVSTV